MAESRFTAAAVYVEIGGQLARVTSAGQYTEINAVVGRVTGYGVYVEIVRAQARATAYGVYVEIGYPRRIRAHYRYDGVDITNYCNAMDMQTLAAELGNKRLDSTAMRAKAGLTNTRVRLAGDWSPTIDALLGRDAFAKHWRNGVVTYEDGIHRIAYTWTAAVQVTEWQINSPATGKLEFNATLRHNGLGVRNVEIS